MESAQASHAARGYPYPLALSVFLVQVGLGTILFATFQEWAPAALGVGDGWGGYLLAAYGGARFLFEAPSGAISDRVERRLGLLIGYALMLPAIGLMAVVRDERIFLGLAAQLGFATAFLWPATYAMSADLYALDRRGKVIAFLNLAQLFGFGVGALAGAFLVNGTDWLQFGAAGIAVAMAFIAAFAGLTNYRQRSLFRLLPAERRPRMRDVVSRRLAGLGAIVLCASIALAMVVPVIRPFGEHELGVSFEHLTLALVPAVLVGVALYLPAGHIADRFGRMRPLFAGEALIVVGLLTCSATSNLAVAAAGAALLFAGNVLTVPALNAAVMDLAPDSHRGTLIGLMVALSGLGLAIGPALGGAALTAWGSRAAFRLAAVVAAAACLGITVYAGPWRQRGSPVL